MKKQVLRAVPLVVIMLTTGVAIAKGEDTVNCLYNNGEPMSEKVCATLRKVAKREAAAQERRRLQDEAAAKRAQERETAKQEREAAYAEQERVRAERERADRQAWTEKTEREEAARQRAAAKVAKAAAEQQADRKAACGGDYKNIRIGMPIERAKECVAPFQLIGETNRPDAVVSTYRVSGGMYAHVINGKIVEWGR